MHSSIARQLHVIHRQISAQSKMELAKAITFMGIYPFPNRMETKAKFICLSICLSFRKFPLHFLFTHFPFISHWTFKGILVFFYWPELILSPCSQVGKKVMFIILFYKNSQRAFEKKKKTFAEIHTTPPLNGRLKWSTSSSSFCTLKYIYFRTFQKGCGTLSMGMVPISK